MNQRGRQHYRLHEAGMASIVITLVTMVVISLIVLGFAVISRREQRNSLDQVLSAQAFYAAESGVEDARSAIRNYLATNPAGVVPAKTSCTANDSGNNIYPVGDDMKVDEAYNISYSCLKVDPAPTSVKFDGVNDSPVVFPLTTANPITSLEISWQPTSQPANPPSSCPAVPAAGDKVFAPQTGANAWKCGYGVLKVDAVTTGNGGNVTRAGLTSSQLSAYFLPTKGNPAGDVNYNTSRGQANIVPVNCNAASGAYGSCTATISNINGGNRTMALRISSIYQPSVVTVQALTGNNPQPISGVQASIDVTGKATDTLRRIEVRLPLIKNGSFVPGQPITSAGSICKRFNVTNGYFNIPGDIVDPDAGNTMCQPKTDGAPSGVPTPAPPSGGNALIDSSCAGVCAGIPPGGSYHYDKNFTNLSTNPPGQVAGCTWDFGDGTSLNNVACLQGQQTPAHTFPKLSPEPPYPAGCYSKSYSTKLTVRLSDGSQATDVISHGMPLCY